MMNPTIATLKQEKVVAIIRGVPFAQMRDTAKALLAGGIRCMEVTFDQRNPESHIDTQRSISLLREEFAGMALAGAGTVTSPELVDKAVEAGATFIISPNTDVAVIGRTKERGAVSMPGSFTPSEAVTAHNAGADFVKLFPAGVLGTAYIKALCAPLNHIDFMAVGGVDPGNLADFLKAGCVGVGVGGNLANNKLIAQGKFDEITALATAFSAGRRQG